MDSPVVREELDREEAAILEGKRRGLGLQGDWMDKANWYGGQIQQMARLEEDPAVGFRLELRKMEMRKSHRFGRYLGSRRLLQISIPAGIVNRRKKDLDAFLSQRFILCGRVFVGAGSKDNKIFLLEVAEDYERHCQVRGDDQRITLEDFVNWHNPLDRNGNQVCLPVDLMLSDRSSSCAACNEVHYTLRSWILSISPGPLVHHEHGELHA